MNVSVFVMLLIGMAIFAAGVIGILLLAINVIRARRRQPQQPKDTPIPRSSAAPQAHVQLPVARSLPYERRAQLLTQAELIFFDVLRAATPDGLVVFPQMRLASIVDVAAQARRDYTHFNRIQAKCIDFVLCDAQTTAPRLVVELDDSSHNRADRRERDLFVDEVLGNAGLPILHVRWQRRYSVEEIGSSIRRHLGINEVAPITGWSKPIAVAPPVNTLAAPAIVTPPAPALFVAEPTAARSRYVCGQCQQEIRQDAKFCSHCGSTL